MKFSILYNPPVWILILANLVANAQAIELRSEVDKIIKYDTQLEIEDNPGFIITVINDESIHHLPYGSTYSDHDAEPNHSETYEVGSITKSFISLLALALQQRGYIDIGGAINDHLHNNYRNPRMENVSVHDLMCHTSGLPIRPDLIGRKIRNAHSPYQNYKKSDLLRFYSSFVPREDQKFQYSHTNYGLLEIIMENATGESIDILLSKYIFQPLEMNDTYIYWNKEGKEDISPGYDKASRLVAPWKYGSHAGSEGCKSTATDLAKYLQYQFTSEEHALDEAISLSHEIQVSQSLNESISTAYGWQLFSRKKSSYPIYTYTGRTSGHSAFIAYVKETKTAVLILSNSVLGTEDLGLQVLRMINNSWKRKV